MSKYKPLTRFLETQTFDRVPMTFGAIEGVLGLKLPRSADSQRGWWSNNAANNVMTKAWLAAGFKTEHVDLVGRTLIFRRIGPASGSKPMANSSNTPPSPFTPSGSPSGFMEAPTPSFTTPGHGSALFGWLAGTVSIAPGTDLAGPADPAWSRRVDNDD